MAILLPSRYQNANTRTADMTQPMIDLSNVVTQINAGLSPAIIANLDAEDQTVSALIPSTPTVYVCPLVSGQNNIGYNTSTGVTTFNQDGTYQQIFLFNVFNTILTTIFFGAELSIAGGPFTSLPFSGRQIAINANIQGQIMFATVNFLTAGTQSRNYLWASNGTATFQTTTLTSLPGGSLMVPAKRQLITGQAT